ncbi:MAG: glycosyltransferase family 4 protein, partial [Candidatus Omnitrophica bacterium]|nr:glycosyltransferase family 4 protein [Candidatus Omnitrophota bacterium]
MKILLVNQAYYPDRVASAVYLTEYAEHVARQGHDVTVLASRFGYDDHKQVFRMSEKINGVKIIRTGSLTISQGNRTARIINALFLNIAFAWKLMSFKKHDCVVAMTSPPLIAFVTLIFTHMKRGRFVYWLLDINPDQAIRAGWIQEKTFRTHLLQKVLHFTLKGSDLIIVLDEYMKKNIVRKKIDSRKVKVHSLWPNSSNSRHYPSQSDLKKKMGLQDKFVVLYAGNHSVCHPLDTLLDCAKDFKDDSSVAFLFVGKCIRVDDVTRFKEAHNLSNIYQFDYQDSWQETLYLADLHVVIMGNDYVGMVHPCKIYN